MTRDQFMPSAQFPIRFLTVVVFLTGVVLASVGWETFRSYQKTKLEIDRNHLIERLRGDILHFDEVLTMSARMAAATGDSQWEDRYRQFGPELDVKIQQIMDLAEDPEAQTVAQHIADANDTLVAMEEHAFELMRQGDFEQASAVLLGEDYEEHKRIYSENTQTLATVLHQATIARLSSTRLVAIWSVVFVLAVFVALVAGWRVVLGTLHRWRDALGETNRQLAEQAQSLTTLNESLEQRVKERTAELAQSNEELRREITERLRAEKTIRNSQALYSSLVENLPVHVIRKDLAGHFTFANRTACGLLGKSLDEIAGKTDVDFYPTELAQKYRNDDRHVAETGELFETVEENRQDGETHYVQVIKSPVRDATGAIVGVQVIFWDVTEQKQAVAALEQERYLLHALMDNLPHNIYFKDEESRFLRINKALTERFGLSDASEAIGKTDFDFFTAEHAEQAREDEVRILETETPLLDREEKETWRDRPTTWATTTKMPLYGESGRVVGTFGISRDITVQKQAAEALRAAKEAAEAANLAKSEFLANVSHEVRTPMNAIIGMTELLLDTELSGPQREYVRLVLESAESLLALINDILDFSKIESGKLDLNRAELDLRESLGDTMKSLALRAHRKGLELAFHVASDVPNVLVGDEQRLRQVLVNLTSNAIKFTEEGEVVVEVECESLTEQEVVLHFTVSDTGIGIPEDKIDAVFGEFEQVDSSTTRKFGGTGLGLAIASRLVRLMAGRIWVESQLGEGSRFHFTAHMGIGQSVQARAEPASRLQALQVLVVDDNATNRRILSTMLQNWGMRPTTVSGVQAAIDALRSANHSGDSFALVLSDVAMPELDGFDLVERIRSDAGLGAPVVMMLTSSDRSHHIARCNELDVAAYLTKPVKQSDLFDAIALALGVSVTEADEPERSSTASGPAISSLRILLAEDSLVNQKLAVDLLNKWGHIVVVANNGDEAVRAVRSEHFDLVLMDIQMPETDGLEATRLIRQQERMTGAARRLPIVAMTAHALKGDRERCLEAGMDQYVSKPIRAVQLRAVLEELFGSDAQDAGTLNPASSQIDVSCAQPEQVVASEDEASESINWPNILARLGGDRGVLKELVELFLRHESPQLLEDVRHGLENQDAALVAHAAHTLKGAAGVFEASGVVRWARELERLGHSGDVQQAEELWNNLCSELSRLWRELETFDIEELS